MPVPRFHGWLAAMTEHPITVGRARDADRFLATDHLVWFGEVPSAATEVQLLGLPEEGRFAGVGHNHGAERSRGRLVLSHQLPRGVRGFEQERLVAERTMVRLLARLASSPGVLVSLSIIARAKEAKGGGSAAGGLASDPDLAPHPESGVKRPGAVERVRSGRLELYGQRHRL